MRAIVPLILCAAVFAVVPLAAQAPAPEEQRLLTLVNELAQKQAQMVDNQSKAEAKVNDLAEAVRTARIFMSRAGGLHKPPKK
jgi:hypothetical protein